MVYGITKPWLSGPLSKIEEFTGALKSDFRLNATDDTLLYRMENLALNVLILSLSLKEHMEMTDTSIKAGIKRTLMKAFFRIPAPLSGHLYSFWKRFFSVDKRRPYFDRAFSEVSAGQTEGDYLEFGVYNGGSFIMAMKLAQKYKLNNMRFFAFDSFQGLPNAEGNIFRKGELNSPEHLFAQKVGKCGVDTSRIVTISGFYDKTLNEDTKRHKHLTRASILHIDCDLYTSTKEVLGFIEGLIDVGSILIFDDWYVPEDMGERKAFAEWRLKPCFEEFFSFDGRSKAFRMKEPPR